MKNRSLFFGVFLIVLGCFFLLSRFGFGINFISVGPEDFWTLIVIGVGLAFELSYFATGRNPGLLVPGGIITTVGLIQMFEVSTDFRFAAYTWPFYILGVALGLFQLYMFGGKNRGLLIPVFILTAVGLACLAMTIFSALTSFIDLGLIIPIVLILIGVLVFISSRSKNRF